MSRSFVKLLVSQLFANLADIFLRVSLIANIFVITKSVIATSMVPILIGLSAFMASFLVPLVTKIIPLNRVLFLTQGGKTALVAILAALFTKFQFVPAVGMYVFVIAISILDGFAAPVSYAMIPRYATNLGKANAALSMSGEGVQLIGWGLGGLLYALVGLFSTMLLVLFFYLLSTFVMLFLPQAKIEQLEAETNLDTLVKGWSLVVKNPPLRLLVQANLLENFSNTIWVSSVILVFVTEVLQQTESYWGYSNTAYSLGIILGGMIVFNYSEKFLAHKWKSIFFPLVAIVAVTGSILFFSTVETFLLFSAGIGFLSQLKEVPESVFLQETVDENQLVHVYSVFEVISTLAFSVFVFLMSSMTEYFGIRTVFYLAMIATLLEAALIYCKRDLLNKG